MRHEAAPASVWSERTEVRRYRGQQWGVESVPGGHQDKPSIRGGLHELGHHLSGLIPSAQCAHMQDHEAAPMRAMRPAAPCSHLHAATFVCMQPCLCSHLHASM